MNFKTEKIERIDYIDLIKCFAIWLVIWGHCIMQLMEHDYKSNDVFLCIYSFHMPLFMLVSGFFAQNSFQLPFVLFLKKKIVQLVIPTLYFGLILYLLQVMLGEKFSTKELFVEEITCYWFLKSLFFCYLIVYFAFTLVKYKWVVIFASLLILLLLQSKGYTFFKVGNMLPFFCIGMFLKGKLNLLYSYRYKVLLISLLIFIVLFHHYSFSSVFSSYFFSIVSFKSVINYLYYIAIGFLGSLSVIAMCMIISHKLNKNKIGIYFINIGKYTLGIYLLQKLFVEFILPHCFRLSLIDFNLYNYLITPLVSFIFLLICYYSDLIRIEFSKMLKTIYNKCFCRLNNK